MQGLDKLSEYFEKGYRSIRFIKKSLRKEGTYSIGLGNDEGELLSFYYNPQRDNLEGGKEYTNEGIDKTLIEMAEEGLADLAVKDIKDWQLLKGILKLPEGIAFGDILNEIRMDAADDVLDKLR